MAVRYTVFDTSLSTGEFVRLFQRVWSSVELDEEKTQIALESSKSITARVDGLLIGCVRLLSDGYLATTIPEVLVDPEFAETDVAFRLFEMATEASSTGIYFCTHPVSPGFLEKLGWRRGPHSYFFKKQQ